MIIFAKLVMSPVRIAYQVVQNGQYAKFHVVIVSVNGWPSVADLGDGVPGEADQRFELPVWEERAVRCREQAQFDEQYLVLTKWLQP